MEKVHEFQAHFGIFQNLMTASKCLAVGAKQGEWHVPGPASLRVGFQLVQSKSELRVKAHQIVMDMM